MLGRIASVLFILHICYHPRLHYIFAAPINQSSSINDGIHDSVEYINSIDIDEHQATIAEILNSTAFENATSFSLRLDNYNSSNPFDLNSRHHLPYIIYLSHESWDNYLKFKHDTCRYEKEEFPKFDDQDFLENGYFNWEENEFHRKLRVLLYPETSNTLKPLIDDDIIDKLDKRFLQKPLESYCYQQQEKHISTEEEAAEERTKFEDTVLNRLLPPSDYFHFTSSTS